MAQEITSPHDKFFRAMLSNKEVAKDFLDWHLPDFIKSKIDLDSVEAQKDSFVDDNFKKLLITFVISNSGLLRSKAIILLEQILELFVQEKS